MKEIAYVSIGTRFAFLTCAPAAAPGGGRPAGHERNPQTQERTMTKSKGKGKTGTSAAYLAEFKQQCEPAAVDAWADQLRRTGQDNGLGDELREQFDPEVVARVIGELTDSKTSKARPKARGTKTKTSTKGKTKAKA